jgi:hypothetical protein
MELDDNPPRLLGPHGTQLWRSIVAEYTVTDPAGREQLCQACAALDRAEEIAAAIRDAGIAADGKANRLLKDELAARAFVVRTLQKLGLDADPIRPVGRQPGELQWTGHGPRHGS